MFFSPNRTPSLSCVPSATWPSVLSGLASSWRRPPLAPSRPPFPCLPQERGAPPGYSCGRGSCSENIVRLEAYLTPPTLLEIGMLRQQRIRLTPRAFAALSLLTVPCTQPSAYVSPSRLRKKSPRTKKRTSGAKALLHSQGLNGTTEVVPFPKPSRIRVFPQPTRDFSLK
jgi:hypothetical protein